MLKLLDFTCASVNAANMASCTTNTKRNLHGLQTRLSDPSRISHAVNRKAQKYLIFSQNKNILSLPWWIETLWQGFNYKVIHQARPNVTYSWSSGKMEGRSFHSSETGKERHEPCSQCQRSNYWMADCSASAWGEKYKLLNLVVRLQLSERKQRIKRSLCYTLLCTSFNLASFLYILSGENVSAFTKCEERLYTGLTVLLKE